MLMRSALFWDITRCRVVIVYRRFGKTYRSHLHGSWVRVVRCRETSVNNYHTTPRNIPEERRSDNGKALSTYSRKTCLSATSCTTKPTWTWPGTNPIPGHNNYRPTTNCLGHGTALEAQVHPTKVYKFSSYLAVNILRTHYKDQPVNAVGETIAVYCATHMTHTNALRSKGQSFWILRLT